MILLTLAVIGVVASNRPQAPGDTLAAAGLLMVPVHAWAALVTATGTGTDTPTREAFIAAFGLRRVMIGHVLAAMVVGAVAGLAVFGTAVGARVMSPRRLRTNGRLRSWRLERGWSSAWPSALWPVRLSSTGAAPGSTLFVWLIVLAALALPLLQVARALGNSRSSEVIGQ